MERNATANVTSDCSNRKFQSMNLAAEIDRTGGIGYNEKNRRCEGVARHNRFTESFRRWNGDNRRRVNGSRRADVNAEVASDGAFPLQKESMTVLKKRQRSAVKLGGNTERFVPYGFFRVFLSFSERAGKPLCAEVYAVGIHGGLCRRHTRRLTQKAQSGLAARRIGDICPWTGEKEKEEGFL